MDQFSKPFNNYRQSSHSNWWCNRTPVSWTRLSLVSAEFQVATLQVWRGTVTAGTAQYQHKNWSVVQGSWSLDLATVVCKPSRRLQVQPWRASCESLIVSQRLSSHWNECPYVLGCPTWAALETALTQTLIASKYGSKVVNYCFPVPSLQN